MTRADRELLKTWKQFFKSYNNKRMWREVLKVEKVWDSLDKATQDHIFDTLNRTFGRDF